MAKNYSEDDDFDIPQFKVKKRKNKTPKFKFNSDETNTKKKFANKYSEIANQNKVFSDKVKNLQERNFVQSVQKDLQKNSHPGVGGSWNANKVPRKHEGDTFTMK